MKILKPTDVAKPLMPSIKLKEFTSSKIQRVDKA
tara:strand:+ start:966 stop:1067 length:102 start_codon:yes stop_codon:yes gene_type:complete